MRSATRREPLICAALPLMKALGTDDGVSSSCADSVRGRSCGLRVCPLRCCLDDGANTFYDKLEGENTAGSDGSGMRQPVESFYSFWPEIDEDILMKRYGGDGSRVLGWIRTFRFCFITYFCFRFTRRMSSVIFMRGRQSPLSPRRAAKCILIKSDSKG